MDIDHIRATIESDGYVGSLHFWDRLSERSIEIEQVLEAVGNGQIVEELPPSGPDPKCVVRGVVERTVGAIQFEAPLYVVVACGEVVTMVTADWNPPREFGKKRGRARR